MKISKIGCPIQYLTGIPCLGCGMTRACLCLMRFDFKKAFYYHPLCYFMPMVFACYLFREKIDKNILNKLQRVLAALFVLVYAVRLLDSGNLLIAVHVKDGLLYQIVSGMK